MEHAQHDTSENADFVVATVMAVAEPWGRQLTHPQGLPLAHRYVWQVAGSQISVARCVVVSFNYEHDAVSHHHLETVYEHGYHRDPRHLEHEYLERRYHAMMEPQSAPLRELPHLPTMKQLSGRSTAQQYVIGWHRPPALAAGKVGARKPETDWPTTPGCHP